ncbi:energy-coupling factor transporter ATP-binding protein EcfA [Sporomusaceae bacterium FL31]|nr:energy-coupling factor transporter ATP-binding protein EcfA [Sporomusaceae bacterium FL31]GCE35076.1 energy-coupling factor transporter ATP-binding protein EcfA [Sporomusaceae bacterium]
MSIILKNVTYTYMPKTPFERTAISDINFEIERGEFVAIIGHTGSGKSTLVQHLNGILKPTSGSVTVDGVDLHDKKNAAKAARSKVGMVFQYPEHQLFEETIYEDIAFGPKNLGLSEEEIDTRVKRAMTFVGLDFEQYATRSPFQLSGGQMRRVAIAGVIALEPEYLILDEPSAGLDPRGRDEIFNEIIQLYQSSGITVILVSHNMEDVAKMATRLIVMNGGKVSLDGTPLEVFSNPEKLRAAGVDVPPVTALLRKLKERGLHVDDKLLAIDEAVATITNALGERTSC